MGRNLGSAFRQELANLDKDPETNKTAMSNLRTIVKDLNAKVIHVFVAQVSETKEIGSESGGYTVSLFEDLARAHGVKIAPHVETIMPVIVRTLSSCDGSLGVQQACSKAVAAIARYGIDPATPEDKRRNVIHSLCKPLSDSLLDTQHQQHLALGSALCLKSLVDCDNWRFASSEVVNSVCQSLAVALEATSSEAKSHMALVIALAKHNPFIVEAYARLLVKSGLRILELGVVEGDSQKRLLAVQMLNFLMKYLNPKSICSELELIYKEMEKHLTDEMYFVRMAAYETMSTAGRLIGESEDPMFGAENSKTRVSLSGSVKSTPSLRAHSMSYVNDQEEEDVLFSGIASGRTIVSGSPLVNYAVYNQETGSVLESPRNGDQFQFPGFEDDNMESVMFHQRNRSSEFNESVCSWTNRSRSSRGKPKKRQSGDIGSHHHRHGFAQDPFTELVENRQQMQQQYSESYSSSSIYDTSGGTTTATTPTEDICEKPKSDLGSEGKVESRGDRSRRVLRWGLSFFSVAVAGFAMWAHLQDDMVIPPHLVPT
ncbi:ARM repeat superfamily protein [Raphanus sativus]|uniref:Protein SINE2 n=1 Tax=Raphanus sativus TaxID=3726 RepID=A0A6J0NN18_RAPSA|nr:protein SINE2 [Raphanus sativus]KAJ4892835.1 ARM repeat superfamily protein [Raphanus sativus]